MLAADTLYTAMTIYHEARGEPEHCQLMVAEVVRNRMDMENLTAKQVVKARGQFSWMPLIRNRTIDAEYKRVEMRARDGDKRALQHAVLLANQVLSPGYVTKSRMDSFHDKSVRVKHRYSQRCENLIFYKR